jgi:hypothetical protein
MLVAHVWFSGAGFVEIYVRPPPISAKKPFVFSDIIYFLRRNYLILRKMTCRYVSTKELRVFLDDGGGGGARRW